MEQTHRDSNHRPLNLLLVDDEPADRMLVSEHLLRSGLDVQIDQADSAAEALELSHSHCYDCLLLDYFLREGEAFELFSELLNQPCGTRPGIVLLTGHGDERIAAKSIQCGVQEYLSKSDLNAKSIQHAVVGAVEKAVCEQEKHHREAQLRHLSFYDKLTELPNRHLFSDRLQQEWLKCQRYRQPFTVLMMDLNGFKPVNDEHGHQLGDRLLEQAADRLRNSVRASDTVARYGGDEFTAILPGTDGPAGVAGKIQSAFMEPFVLDHQTTVQVGISIGVATYPEHGEDIQSLLCNADQAMYEAKKNRSGVCIYQGIDPSTNNVVVSSPPPQPRPGELFLAYQPIICLESGAVVSMEALLRWQHPQQGTLTPSTFLPTIKDRQALLAIAIETIELALAQMQQWQQQGLTVDLSLNVPASVINEADAIKCIGACLARTTVDPRRLCFEMSETGVMAHPTATAGGLLALSALGVHIAIDDFGAGYCSLKHLRDFPIDEIKIDRLFVSGLTNWQADANIVESVVALGRAFDARVVAAGIEDEATRMKLIELGCRYGQGDHFAKAMAAEQIPQWYRQQPSLPLSQLSGRMKAKPGKTNGSFFPFSNSDRPTEKPPKPRQPF